MHQRLAQSHRPFEALFIVLRTPGALLAGIVVDDRCIHHDGRGREAILERRRIEEGLEARAGLAARLGRAVELVVEVVEAADQGDDGAVVRVERDQRALRLGQLRELRRAAGRRSRHRRRRRACRTSSACLRRAARAGLGRAAAGPRTARPSRSARAPGPGCRRARPAGRPRPRAAACRSPMAGDVGEQRSDPAAALVRALIDLVSRSGPR